MRGRQEPRVTMLAFVDLEERVPADHPLRTIKVLADEALVRLSPEFDRNGRTPGRSATRATRSTMAARMPVVCHVLPLRVVGVPPTVQRPRNRPVAWG